MFWEPTFVSWDICTCLTTYDLFCLGQLYNNNCKCQTGGRVKCCERRDCGEMLDVLWNTLCETAELICSVDLPASSSLSFSPFLHLSFCLVSEALLTYLPHPQSLSLPPSLFRSFSLHHFLHLSLCVSVSLVSVALTAQIIREPDELALNLIPGKNLLENRLLQYLALW